MNREQRRASGNKTPGKGLVLACYLTASGGLSPRFAHSFTMVSVREVLAGRLIGFEDHESSANISSGRNDLVRRFLDHPLKPDWLWMLDSDMTFGADILDQLLRTADATERPIVGGLCFSVGPPKGETPNATLGTSLELRPTIFHVDGDRLRQDLDYEPGTVIQCDSTGAACLLIHRRVLEDARWAEDGHPFPWFRETVAWGKPCSEDQRFCLQAGVYGYPIHVDTAARTGHHKTFVADEAWYQTQRAEARCTTP